MEEKKLFDFLTNAEWISGRNLWSRGLLISNSLFNPPGKTENIASMFFLFPFVINITDRWVSQEKQKT